MFREWGDDYRSAVVNRTIVSLVASAENAVGLGALLGDDRLEQIKADGFLFLIGLIADQSMSAERAWALPFELKERIGFISVESLADTDIEVITRAIQLRPSLHRYPRPVARYVSRCAKIIVQEYDGDSSLIWTGCPEATTIRRRLLRLPGIGPKKAALAILMLVRDLGIAISDKESIGLAFDVHVSRVMTRVGILRKISSDEADAVAGQISPDFPGRLTSVFWYVGRNYCFAKTPHCLICPLQNVCSKCMGASSGQL